MDYKLSRKRETNTIHIDFQAFRPGNERAGHSMRSPQHRPQLYVNIDMYSDTKNKIVSYIQNEWHTYWRDLNTKLSEINNGINL
jgi:hypothetical protein